MVSVKTFVMAMLLLMTGSIASVCHAQTQLSYDFNTSNSWSSASRYTSAPEVTTSLTYGTVGSYDTRDSSVQSNALRFTVTSPSTSSGWWASFTSPPLTFSGTQGNLNKLTLSFDLSASQARPVTVEIISLDASNNVVGRLEKMVYPAAANFQQRFAIDLNTMTQVLGSAYAPGTTRLRIGFKLLSSDWPNGSHRITVDNVFYGGPAYYVKPGGNDGLSGKTETDAFRTIQQALNVAAPGDIILVRAGTYNSPVANDPVRAVASFKNTGTVAAWVVLKNYPGETPVLTSNGYNIVSITKGYGGVGNFYNGEDTLAYIEVRGLTVRGEGDLIHAGQKFQEYRGTTDPRSNTAGITVEGRFMKRRPHHIRFADNVAEYCPGGGIGSSESDWVMLENNIARYNCWTTVYGTSGIGTIGATNFDSTDNIYKMLIRNNTCYRNETYELYAENNKYSDGNGIIIDVNQHPATSPNDIYIGRTLIQNNLSFDNGGGGIHLVTARRVDIVNNTAYLNSAAAQLRYAQIDATFGSDDVNISNNILVARTGSSYPINVASNSGTSTNIRFRNNLYYGGDIAPVLGTGDKVGNPLFAVASTNPTNANFRLNPGSPAINLGLPYSVSPRVPTPYLDFVARVRGSSPDVGAYEK